MNDKTLKVFASVGVALGGALGLAGTFAPSASLRGLAWGIDGAALVMASALLTVHFYRLGQDVVAAAFIVCFAVGDLVHVCALRHGLGGVHNYRSQQGVGAEVV